MSSFIVVFSLNQVRKMTPSSTTAERFPGSPYAQRTNLVGNTGCDAGSSLLKGMVMRLVALAYR